MLFNTIPSMEKVSGGTEKGSATWHQIWEPFSPCPPAFSTLAQSGRMVRLYALETTL